MTSALLAHAQSLKSYNYKPLHADNEIRLVTLLPGTLDAPIECQLHHTSLSQSPDYEALSYTWGSLSHTSTILLDNYAHEVTSNLRVALQHLRFTDRNRILWIDAICIDQKCLPERNQQVRIMGKIYQSARNVLAWLGPEANDSDEAIDMLEELYDLRDKLGINQNVSTSPRKLSDAGFDADTKNWTAFWHLLQRPYWNRMWIVQEQYYSGDVGDDEKDRCVIGCGARWFPRSYIRNANIFLLQVRAFANKFVVAFPTDITHAEPFKSQLASQDRASATALDSILISLRPGIPADKLDHLSELMRVSRLFNATDPKDFIFALLPMTDKALTFPIDYSRTTHEIFRLAIEFAIEEDADLSILLGNRAAPTAESRPTWSPLPRSFLMEGQPWRLCNLLHLFDASRGVAVEPPRFNHQGSVFLVRGVIIGRVDHVIGPYDPLHLLSYDEQQKVLDELASQMDPYQADLSIEQREAFWRTFVLDHDASKVALGQDIVCPAPTEWGHQFEALIRGEPIPDDFMPEQPLQQRKWLYFQDVALHTEVCRLNRCFFDTDSGHMGLGPYRTRPGDVAVVLLGGPYCFMLRPVGDYYELLGDAYIHGAMHGEMLKLNDAGEVIGLQEFGLI